MRNLEALKGYVQDLAAREWDVPAIEARYRRLLRDGIAPRPLEPTAVAAAKAGILARVQRRGEEYEYLSHN